MEESTKSLTKSPDTKNTATDIEALKKAAERGDAEAQNDLGWCYQYGKGVPKDEKEAVRWYTTAAAKGYAAAQNNLGWCYCNGVGVPKDSKQAVRWLRLAADQGHAAAQNNLGWCCEKGIGVPKDSKQAVRWYKTAVAKEHAEAQFNLGWCYENSIGVSKNEKEAVRWYRAAAAQGYAVAQFNLGWCYENGIDVKQNLKFALYWYRQAIDQFRSKGTKNTVELTTYKDAEKAAQRLTRRGVSAADVEEQGLPIRDSKHEQPSKSLWQPLIDWWRGSRQESPSVPTPLAEPRGLSSEEGTELDEFSQPSQQLDVSERTELDEFSQSPQSTSDAPQQPAAESKHPLSQTTPPTREPVSTGSYSYNKTEFFRTRNKSCELLEGGTELDVLGESPQPTQPATPVALQESSPPATQDGVVEDGGGKPLNLSNS